MARARALDAAAGVSTVYVQARVEDTSLPDAGFDVVGAGQCWHWFDRPRAAAEARRVLVPGGALLITYFDWLPLPGNVVHATEQLILRHNPHWKGSGGTGVYPSWFADVAGTGFGEIESFTFDIPAPYIHEGWRGRIRTSAGIAASLPPDRVATFDAEHTALLRERFPEEPLLTPHRVFALICRAPRT